MLNSWNIWYVNYYNIQQNQDKTRLDNCQSVKSINQTCDEINTKLRVSFVAGL